jgi:AcrR family transcriptional regulator
MNQTKQNILSHSRQLFNEFGTTNVSLRTIADNLEISVGNLHYHFKKREDIIEGLYFELVEEMNTIMVEPTGNLLESVLDISSRMIYKLYDYRFFFLDFVTITRKNEVIKQHYSELSQQREAQFLQISEVMIQNSIFREERLKGEYLGLFKRIELMTNFWFSSVLIQKNAISAACLEDFKWMIHQSLFPYLTVRGREEFAASFPHLMSPQ